MKRFLKHIVLFGLLFFIAEKGFYFFVQNASKKEYDKRLELILEGEMNKDIIIIGSSRGANNIIAKQLEDQTGLSTYNLSYRGSDINFHEFILSTLLKFNTKPKKLILTIDSGYEFVYEPTLNFRYDRLYPLKKYNYIRDELIKRNKKNILSNTFQSALVNLKDFDLKPVKVLPVNVMTSHGSKVISSSKQLELVFDTIMQPYDKAKEQIKKLEAFDKIQNVCKQNNIELILLFPPNYSRFNSHFFNRFKKLVKQESKILIYDTLNKTYKDDCYFRDVSHLLKNGAEIFTSEISTFVNQN